MINKDEGDCLSYLQAHDECYDIVAACMRKHVFDVVASVKCCEEQDCGRDKNKPASLMDQMAESSCIFKCMVKSLPSFADIYQEFMVIFAPTGTDHKKTKMTSEAELNAKAKLAKAGQVDHDKREEL